MKANLKITNLTAEELDYFLHKALVENMFMMSDYKMQIHQNKMKLKATLGTTLLNGGVIQIDDMVAAGEVHGKKGTLDKDSGIVIYSITLKDIERGLGKAFNEPALRDAVLTLVTDFDSLYSRDAEMLLKYICFGKVID